MDHHTLTGSDEQISN